MSYSSGGINASLKEDVDVENAIQKAVIELLGIQKRSAGARSDLLDSTALALADAMYHHIHKFLAKKESKGRLKGSLSAVVSAKTSTNPPACALGSDSKNPHPPHSGTQSAVVNAPLSNSGLGGRSCAGPGSTGPPRKRPRRMGLVQSSEEMRAAEQDAAIPAKKRRSAFHEVMMLDKDAAAAVAAAAAFAAAEAEALEDGGSDGDEEDANTENKTMSSPAGILRARKNPGRDDLTKNPKISHGKQFQMESSQGAAGSGRKSPRTRKRNNASANQPPSQDGSRNLDVVVIRPESSRNDTFVHDSNELWWQIPGNDKSSASRTCPKSNPSSQTALRGKLHEFVVAITWACVSDSWSSDELVRQHKADSSSRAGALFSDVSFIMGEMERARKATVQELKWSSELVETLESKPLVAWKGIDYDPTFEQFAGCDVCCKFSRSSRLLWAGGETYNSSSYWPKAFTFRVASTEVLPSGSTRVAFSVSDTGKCPSLAPWPAESCAGKKVVALDTRDPNTAEFWVDELCIQRCTFYHELSHVVARVSNLVRQKIISILEEGAIELPSVPGTGVPDEKVHLPRLQTFIVEAIFGNDNFMDRTIDWLLQMYILAMACLDEQALNGDADAGNSKCKLTLNDRQKVFLGNVMAQHQQQKS